MGHREVVSFATSGNNLFAGTINYGIFVSSNNGTNWTQTSLNNRTILSLAVSVSNIFAGTFANGVYLSTNNGASWTQTSLGTGKDIYSLAVNGNYIFAGTGTPSEGVFLSTDNGTSWVQTSLNDKWIYSLTVNGNYIIAGTGSPGYGVYFSTDNGTSWTQTSLNNRIVYALAANGNNIFAGTYFYGVYHSSNNGTNWVQTSLNQSIYSLAASGNNIFAGCYIYNPFFISTNNGVNWTQRTEGMENVPVNALFLLNNYIFAGTSYSVYRRPLGELVGISPISNEIPKEFSLSQNYPNPFNPTTHFEFQIAKSGLVNLKIFDALGKEIAILVNEELAPGRYNVKWNATNYPSGVYFYKLSAGEFTNTRKMVLVK
jgi:hypothetical protein